MTIPQRLPLTGLPTLTDLEANADAIDVARDALVRLKQRRLALLRELRAQDYPVADLAHVAALSTSSVRLLLAGRRGTAVT